MVEHVLSAALVLLIAGEAALLLVALSLILVAASAALRDTGE